MMKRVLPKAYAALLLYLATTPLFLLPAAALLADRAWIALLLPIPALILTGLAGLLPARRRTAALLVALLIAAAGCAALFLQTTPLAMLLFLPCLLVMLLFMPVMARPAHREWTVSRLGYGIVLHIAAQFLKSSAVFASVAAPVSWAFTAYLVLCLFTFNRLTLSDTGQSTSRTLLFANRRLLTALCLLAMLLANLRAVADGIRAAITWIITGVVKIVDWLASLMQSDAVNAGPAGGNPLEGLAGAETEQSLFSKIVEIALLVFAALIAAALLFFAVKYLIRTLKKAFRAVMERLKLYRQRISADYDDQSESLLDWGEIRKTARTRIDRLRRRYLPTAWEKLSPAERVRRVYALLLRRPENPDPALTAREMLQSGALRLNTEDAAQAASLYERARYSSHPIAPREADDLRKRAGV